MRRFTSGKSGAASVSVISNSLLVALKLAAGLLSGSVSILSEAIHSSIDLIAALIAFFSVRFSSKPADKIHPYGHGKIENVSGVTEGLLILVAAVMIIREAVLRILHPAPVGFGAVAACVMLFSAVVNFFVSRFLFKTAKQEDSIALEADALHLKTDVWTSLGVAVGITLITLFPAVPILDPIVAILVACLIIKEAFSLCRNAFSPLLDSKLSDEEEKKIAAVIENYRCKIVDFHSLRTRKSGSVKYIDFHLTVAHEMTVEQSHSLCEQIECDLEAAICHTNVNIHIEPDNLDTQEGRL
ncbi:MAG: cation diffusion facilitator family transporter [Clostridia bacterium]|nr:cation diffusion facilitator family transporter [Clostridia bacterium]